MRAWFFTEDAYPDLPDVDSYESIRVNLPNKHFDPSRGADLYNMYLDMWCAADEMGLNIMNNEHHQTATCMVPAAPIMLGILARETKNARLLILGNPVANRSQPVRVAEEMALIDVLSRGRLECGFVRGVPYEIAPANVFPYRGTEKLWEAHDLITKAWTTHDGPFSFEGRWFHARQINIWPRPYQQPHPPVWVTMGSAESAAQVAKRGHIGAVFLAGYPRIRSIFDGYREGYLDSHGKEMPIDRLAYCALISVGETEQEGLDVAEKLLWYMTSNKVPSQYSNPPGYHSTAMAATMMRGNSSGTGLPTATTLAEQMARGNVFAGTPDQVYDQIKNFYDYCGGFGNLMMMSQAGFMTFDETLSSMKLFSEEVYPRLKELTAGYDAGRMQEIRATLPDVENINVSAPASEFVR
ncbi:MAG TPA: LLM class flavin-dependent oxidoreductase [Dehalococcoidia bacterium]|nr:LLM class flavin-dependent oxidoreductase [Dehalococcoidia bacterium]